MIMKLASVDVTRGLILVQNSDLILTRLTAMGSNQMGDNVVNDAQLCIDPVCGGG